MTPSDILKLYRRTAPVIGYRSSAWIMLLALAEAGEKGLTRYEFHKLIRSKGQAVAPVLRRWTDAGILTARRPSKAVGRGGLPAVIYLPTPKLYYLLGFETPEALKK